MHILFAGQVEPDTAKAKLEQYAEEFKIRLGMPELKWNDGNLAAYADTPEKRHDIKLMTASWHAGKKH